MIIGFDLDGCVVDFISSFVQTAKNNYGFNLDANQITNYNIHDIPNSNLDKATVDKVIDSVLLNQSCLTAYPGAIGFIYSYYYTYCAYWESRNRRPVYFITSRNDKYLIETRNWLSDNLPGILFELILAKDKQDACINFKLDYFVEDNPIQVFKSLYDTDNSRFNTTILMPIRPWNLDVSSKANGFLLSKLIKFHHWRSVYNIFCAGRTK